MINLNSFYLKSFVGLILIMLPLLAYAELPVKIFPGSDGFHEVNGIDNGDLVWAILKNKNEYELSKVKVVMKFEHSPLRDAPGEMSSRILIYPEKSKTLLLLTDFMGAAEGPVNITRYDKVLVDKWLNQIIRPTSFNIKYGDTVFTIRAEYGGDIEDSHPSFNDLKVILSQKNKKQILFRNSQTLNPYAALILVGDIDRDGQPDFLIKTSTHYSYVKFRLFLSSQHGDGDFVKEVGTYYEGE